MPVLVDLSGSATRLDDRQLRSWAQSQAVFISSEMHDLQPERFAVRDALLDLGFKVVMFEDLGGRDDDAEQAYLAGVAQCSIYLGIVADRYGRMLPSGRSPTHEEYRLARDQGKRISIWTSANDTKRQGNARDFVDEIRVFHTTGQFGSGEDLATRVVGRMGELGADDLAPWVKIGDAVFRASEIHDDGNAIEVTATIHDPRIVSYIESLRPGQWGRNQDVAITTAFRSSAAHVRSVAVQMRSTASRDIKLAADVDASNQGSGWGASTGGFSPEDQVELGLRAGLVGDEPPETFRTHMSHMLDTTDPLAELRGLHIPEDSFGSIARLLLVERLIGSAQASSIDTFRIGPAHMGQRALVLAYTENPQYGGQEPRRRQLEGQWRP